MDIGDIKYLEVKEAPKVLKLSEAIRVGAKIRPQCHGRLFGYGGSCALGAALEAIGKENLQMGTHDIADLFGVPRYVAERVAVKNDGPAFSPKMRAHTREEIADWLESEGY